jgi:hypothetical protein
MQLRDQRGETAQRAGEGTECVDRLRMGASPAWAGELQRPRMPEQSLAGAAKPRARMPTWR